MSDPSTKNCRHCGEAILQVARVCKHCRSHQSFFAGQQDPRYFFLIIAVILPLVVVPLALFRPTSKKLSRTLDPDTSCVRLLDLKASTHSLRLVSGSERLFVRVQVQNRWKSDVSGPVFRILVLGPTGEVEDTFIRRVYDANIPPGQPYWLRVDADLATAPDNVKEVRAEVVSVDCKAEWE